MASSHLLATRECAVGVPRIRGFLRFPWVPKSVALFLYGWEAGFSSALKFIEAGFMAWHLVCPGERPVCLEENVCSAVVGRMF